MKIVLAFILFLVAGMAFAQQPPRPPPGMDQQQWNNQDRIPRWCRHYSFSDYKRELWRCEADRDCRHNVRRKAEICGLRN
jgi:hypothetical protein